LAESDYFSLRQIADVAAAEKREHVVLAQAVERDVLDQHHLVVVLVKDGASDDVGGAHTVAVGQLAQRSSNSVGSVTKALSARILAQLREQLLDQLTHPIDWLDLGHARILTQLRGGCGRGGSGAL